MVHDSLRIVKELETPFNEAFESVTAELECKGFKFLVSEFYRLPNSDESFFTESLRVMLQTCNKYETAFVCCDQNHDLLKCANHSQTRELVSTMFEHGLIPYISKPTRTTHCSSTLIDNIYFKSKTLPRNNSFMVVDGMSDHYPCLLLVIMKAREQIHGNL